MKDGDFGYQIPAELIAKENRDRADDLDRDYDSLREGLRRSGILSRLGVELDQITDQVSRFEVAVPSWALASGGGSSGASALPGEPADIFEKLVDARTIQSLSGATPRVALRLPRDRVDDPVELKEFARRLEIGFDAVDSSAFQERPGERPSSEFGILSSPDPQVRAQAVERHLASIEFGKAVGSEALAIEIGDGGGPPGQVHFRRSLDRAIECLGEIHRALPEGWRLFLSNGAAQEWGTSQEIAKALGERAFCRVDVDCRSGGAGIERVVARLISLGKLGGLRFNDSRFTGVSGMAGPACPHSLFLIFCELVDAENDPEVDKTLYRPACVIDRAFQGPKDPIEELLQTAEGVRRAYAKALLVDRAALAKFQERDDAVSAGMVLDQAFETDVRPILQTARVQKGAAADPIGVYRRARYREEKARERKPGRGAGGGFR